MNKQSQLLIIIIIIIRVINIIIITPLKMEAGKCSTYQFKIISFNRQVKAFDSAAINLGINCPINFYYVLSQRTNMLTF